MVEKEGFAKGRRIKIYRICFAEKPHLNNKTTSVAKDATCIKPYRPIWTWRPRRKYRRLQLKIIA
jgi:hypothetical protein